jgi:hypothetical protein
MSTVPFYEASIPFDLQGRLERFFSGDVTFTALDLYNVLGTIYGVKNTSTYFAYQLDPRHELYIEDSSVYRFKVATMCNLNQFNDDFPKWVRITFDLQNEMVKFSGRKNIPAEYSFSIYQTPDTTPETITYGKEKHDDELADQVKPARRIKQPIILNDKPTYSQL